MGTNTQGLPEYPDPAWFETFRKAYASSHAYLLHGNTQDYAIPQKRLDSWLGGKIAASNYDIVIYYDIARGATFELDSMRERAEKLLGLDEQADSSQNELLAALGQSTGKGGGFNWQLAPADALPLLEALLVNPTAKTAVIVSYAETIATSADPAGMNPAERANLITLARWGNDRRIKKAKGLIFLLTSSLSSLAEMVREASACWRSIEIPLPDLNTRQAFCELYANAWKIPMDMSVAELARASAGLALVHLEQIFQQADQAGKLSWNLVTEAKDNIIRTKYSGLLTILDPSYGFDKMGGLDRFKGWARWAIIDRVRSGKLEKVPKGVILVGPPGTGKTYAITGLAFECKFNALILNLGTIQGGIVGETEKKLSMAFAAIRSLSPCLVFLDEIDQSAAAQRGNNSGNPVDKNIFQMVLTFLGDPTTRGKVIFFAACNRPDIMDTAMMRSGRIDAIIPFLLPSKEERRAIAEVHVAKQGYSVSGAALDALAAGTDKWSSADIEALVRKCGDICDRTGAAGIDGAVVERALWSVKPVTLGQASFYEKLAIGACTDRELMPEDYARLLDDRAQLDKEVKAEREELDLLPKRERREF